MDEKLISNQEHISSRWQTAVLRAAWLLITTLVLVMIVLATPLRYHMLQADVYGYADGLQTLGLSLSFFAAYFLGWELLVMVGSLGVAALIAWKQGHDWFAMLVATALTLFGLLTPLSDGISFVYPQWTMPIALLRFIELGCLMAVFCLFPNGRFTPRWLRWLLFSYLLFSLIIATIRPDILADTAVLPNTRTLQDALWLLVGVSWYTVAIVGQIVRYQRHSNRAEKQQTKWALFGFTIIVLFSLISALLLVSFPQLNNSPDNRTLYTLIMGALYLLSALALPVTIALSILRYRLWEVDILLNRTLVYGGLTALITAVYILIIGGVWTLATNLSGQILGLLLATAFVLVGIRPLHQRIQTSVNRMMFGERDDPYTVLSKLGTRLQATAVPNQTLPTITATICQTLKLPYAAIIVQTDTGGRSTIAASGQWTPLLEEWPLHYQGQVIGWLVIAPRSPGEAFNEREKQLLADIAAQAGAATYAMRLHTDLQRSRAKLVLTREEERRRIRRDLHDGLGPTLASQTFTLDAAIDLLDADPAAAEKLLRDLKTQNQTIMADIRRLVYELRPPTLDELGLADALAAHVQQLNGHHHTLVTLNIQPGTLEFLPAAVDVAIYRLVQEGVNNVLRHAQATTCTIAISRADGRLTLSIRDDGRGIAPDDRNGVGLFSMRERVEELGGTLAVVPRLPSGTQITAILPSGDPYAQIGTAVPDDLPVVR